MTISIPGGLATLGLATPKILGDLATLGQTEVILTFVAGYRSRQSDLLPNELAAEAVQGQ
jgi:hypothetical protein